ncbi:MAG: hypothetical protein PHV18_13085 [Lachnospiraceae bacterium]|nr:hypothetical protein [Lachnospiraceae bacterium]
MRITEESMKQQNSAAPNPESQPQRTEREKLHAMNRKDQIWYIWAYYKFHILGALLAVVVLICTAQTLYRSSFQTVLHVIYLNSRSEAQIDFTPLEQDFAAYLELGRKETITAEESFISFGSESTEFSYAAMAKISAMTAAQSLDVLIGDTASTAHYASMNGFLDLETALSGQELALIRDRLYYAKDENGQDFACAIDLSGTAFADASHLAQDKPLLGILVNSKHTDTARALISYIFAR